MVQHEVDLWFSHDAVSFLGDDKLWLFSSIHLWCLSVSLAFRNRVRSLLRSST